MSPGFRQWGRGVLFTYGGLGLIWISTLIAGPDPLKSLLTIGATIMIWLGVKMIIFA